MAVMDAALEQFDFIDPDRLGVMGGSYGGYMTSWIVGQHRPLQGGVFGARSEQHALRVRVVRLRLLPRAYTGVSPFEDVQPYLAQSPTTYAADITTPLLILHSENDLRCNIEQAEHLFIVLRLLGA